MAENKINQQTNVLKDEQLDKVTGGNNPSFYSEEDVIGNCPIYGRHDN